MIPKLQWEHLKTLIPSENPKWIIKRIDEIDEETPWSGREPDWWVEMMDERTNLKTMNEL